VEGGVAIVASAYYVEVTQGTAGKHGAKANATYLMRHSRIMIPFGNKGLA
jgi:hypothetical protein